MSEESIENITKSGSNFGPTFLDHHLLIGMSFNGHCLIKNYISFPKKVIDLYISDTLGPQLRNLSTYFIQCNCLFGSVKLAKNANPDKYTYADYGIGFDFCLEFSTPDRTFGKNIIVFGADLSSSVHIDNKGKDILILGEGLTQGLDDMALIAEAKYPITFTQLGKRFVLSQHYNGSNSFLFVNAMKVYQFKAKNPEIKDYSLGLVIVSKGFTINNLKKTVLKGVARFFSVDFNSNDSNDILDIHKYLMKRT